MEMVRKEEDESSYVSSITNEMGTWIHEGHEATTNEDLMHKEQTKNDNGFTSAINDIFFHLAQST